MRKGFTLLEIVIGMALFAVLAVSANLFLFSTLRSARKSTAGALVKNEGALAMETMSQVIRYSKAIVCGAGTLTATRQDDTQVTYSINGSGALVSSGAVTGFLTDSTKVVVTACGTGLFNCSTNNSGVTICYTLETLSGSDVTDKAGVSGVQFRSQVNLRNFGI